MVTGEEVNVMCLAVLKVLLVMIWEFCFGMLEILSFVM